jgi:limonene-1,2-epoxide hydrolase
MPLHLAALDTNMWCPTLREHRDRRRIEVRVGPEEAAELFNSMGAMGFRSVDVDFRNVVSAGDVVCTERVDWLVRPDGSRVGPLPIVGVTEFRDGKITAWREYFDSGNAALREASTTGRSSSPLRFRLVGQRGTGQDPLSNRIHRDET